MTAERGSEGQVVERPRTEAEIITEQGYIIVPKLMRIDAVAYDGPIYDSLDLGGMSYGPVKPVLEDGRLINWMFLGLAPDPLKDPLNPGASRRIGIYLFYDPKQIETISQHHLEYAGYNGEDEDQWAKRRETWKNAGWVLLDRGESTPSSNPAVVNSGDWFIRRKPQLRPQVKN